MKLFFVFTFLFVASLAQAYDFDNNCDFYLKADRHFACSQDPRDHEQYLLRYGYRMCQKYSEKQIHWPSPLQNFITQVASCLQDKVAAYFNTSISCSALGKMAFASHYDCYLRAGFCELNLQNRLKVFKVALEPNLIFNGTWSLGYRLWQKCGQ